MNAAQLTLESASLTARLNEFMQSYPIEWAGKTKVAGLPHSDTKVQYEATIIGSGMQGMYDLAEALYGEPAYLYGPVARAKEQQSSRYYTILTRRISRVGRGKAKVGEWGYFGIESTLEAALANLPTVRSGAFIQA
ncbi:hypothetical protein [Hymenobacter tenuis]